MAALIAEGELEEVEVAGWSAPGYLRAGQTVPRAERGTALLCPFDPLIFFRPRVQRLFGFEYRIEIYTPAPKRKFGYYVWPFLLDGRLVGRVDLKADRNAGALNVIGAFAEDGSTRRAWCLRSVPSCSRWRVGWAWARSVWGTAGSWLRRCARWCRPRAGLPTRSPPVSDLLSAPFDRVHRVSERLVMKSVNSRLAAELEVEEARVAAAVRLLDEGSTVPFIARYRKEVTGGLDDGQLRTLEERLAYLRELDQRRTAVLASIEEQGQLTDALRAALFAADTKARVEDIYLPYKPKRRTKAQIAREAGLEPLADRLLADPSLCPETIAAEFLNEDVADAAAALEGARNIVVERAAENAELVGAVREKFWSDGSVRTKPWSEEAAKTPAGQKFRDYFDFSESLETMPSHRVLAVMRGEKEQVLSLTLDGGDDEPYQAMIAQALGIDMAANAPATPWLKVPSNGRGGPG